MFTLKSIRTGMKYKDVRNSIIKSNDWVITCLPSFCRSDYNVAENLHTKETVYILRDYDTDLITDVTKDFAKAVDIKAADRNIGEILQNNGY